MISRSILSVLFLTPLAVAGCGAHEASMPSEARPLWDRCESTLQRYCRERSEGASNIEHACMRDWRDRYVALRDDTGRRALVTSYGCPAPDTSSGGSR